MPARGRAALLALLAAGLGLAALLALAGPAAAQTVECEEPWLCTITLRPREDRMQDTWVDELNPGRNYDSGDGSQFLQVRGGAGQQAWTLLRFPLEDLPRNATLTSGEENAFILLNAPSLTPGRTLETWELREPFEESSVTWQVARNLGLSLTAVNNHTIRPPPLDTPGPFRIPISESIRKAYLCMDRERVLREGLQLLCSEPIYGWVIKDTDPALEGLPATQRFNSSSELSGALHRPALVMRVNPQPPEIRNLLIDGQRHANATSTRRVNLSVEVFDPLGDVTGAWINATDLTGREWFNFSVFQNRSSQFLNFLRHQTWRNDSLPSLPEGRYILNAFALDNDGNLNFTRFQQVNLTVENTPPFVNRSRAADGTLLPFVDATSLDEGQGLTARANASDASGIASVRLEVKRGAEVLANLSFKPQSVDANASGDWVLEARAEWAGALNLTVWVEDRAGNLNLTGPFPLQVRDILPPVIVEARVLAPEFRAEGAVQEAGGGLAWEARIRDASPLRVTLRVEGPEAVELAMERAGQDLWRAARNFTRPGAYAASIVALDPTPNRAERAGLGFVLLAPEPPRIAEPSPTPDGFATAQPVISAAVQDLNLDAGSITLEARLGAEPFTPLEARTVTLSGTARRVEAQERFFDRAEVEVRVRARDLLGNEAERAWRFTVDARAPATFVTLEGPSIAGNRTAITGNTTLLLVREDEGSGVLATVVSLLQEDLGVAERNVTITGRDPFRLHLRNSSAYAGTGNYTLFLGSVDAAGNVEPVQRKRLLVDDSPPRLSVDFEPGLLTARVREEGVGLRDVRAQFWLAPSGEQGSAVFSPTGEPGVWQARIPDAERGAQVLYAVEATDLLGNVGRAGTASQPLRSIVQNHRPLVQISPANGSLVRGVVEVAWSASDRDGDALTTSLSVRPSTATRAIELAPRRGAQGSVAWDTRAVGDGLWVLDVMANDGFEVVRATSLLEVANTESKIVALEASQDGPGRPARVEATLYRPVRLAEAAVSLEGREVDRVRLEDAGTGPDRAARDGVFTGAFTPPRTGEYRIALHVAFEDGLVESREEAAVLRVQHAFPERLVRDPVFLVPLLVAPAALAGWWLWRRYL